MTLARQADPHSERFLREAKVFAEGGDVHAQKFAQSEPLRNRSVRTLRDDAPWRRSHNTNMAKKLRSADHYDALKSSSGWYLAAYRDLAGLTLEALAEAMGTSKGQVSDLETGAVNKRGIPTRYNRDWLEAACQALDVAAGDLLDTNPVREEPRFAALRRAFPGLSSDDAASVAVLAESMAKKAG